VGVVDALPQLPFVTQDQRLAVDGRPDLALWPLAPDLLNDLVPERTLHVALWPLQLAVAAVDARKIADRGVLDGNLRRKGVLLETLLDGEQLAPPLGAVEMPLSLRVVDHIPAQAHGKRD
jgi:hypothetical protein